MMSEYFESGEQRLYMIRKHLSVFEYIALEHLSGEKMSEGPYNDIRFKI